MTEGNPPTGPQPGLGEQAFARLKPELEALPKKALKRVNLDVETVTSIVVSSASRLAPVRPQLEETFKKFNFDRFDRLEDYGWCLQYTHTLCLTTGRPSVCSEELLEEGAQLRRLLTMDAEVLAARGLIPGSRLRNLSHTQGYLNLSADLQILAIVLESEWPRIEGKCSAPLADVRRANALAHEFLRVASRMKKTPEEIATAKEWRRRAFTLCCEAYNDVRLGVLYVRAKTRDAEAFAPTLFKGQSRRRRKKSAEVEANVARPTPPVSDVVELAQSVTSDPLESPFIDVVMPPRR